MVFNVAFKFDAVSTIIVVEWGLGEGAEFHNLQDLTSWSLGDY